MGTMLQVDSYGIHGMRGNGAIAIKCVDEVLQQKCEWSIHAIGVGGLRMDRRLDSHIKL